MPKKTATRRKGRRRSPGYAKIHLTDHAIVQYLVRRKGLELAALYREMLPPHEHDVILAMGDGDYALSHGKLVVRSKTVVTVKF